MTATRGETPATASTGNQRPFWMTEPCPGWCEGHHVDWEAPADRDHVGYTEPVALSLGDPLNIKRHTIEELWPEGVDDLDCRFPHLRVSINQGWRENSPRIAVCVEDNDDFFELTPAEADQFIQALQRAANLASQDDTAGQEASAPRA